MKFHILAPFRVRFSETDMAGVVHFSQILRWVENAESDFFREHKLEFAAQNQAAGTLAGWPRAGIEVRFLAPARYNDEIRVEIRPASVPAENSGTILWEFRVFAVEPAGTLRNIAQGTWTTVFAQIDVFSGKIKKMHQLPQNFLEILAQY